MREAARAVYSVLYHRDAHITYTHESSGHMDSRSCLYLWPTDLIWHLRSAGSARAVYRQRLSLARLQDATVSDHEISEAHRYTDRKP